MNQTIQTQPAPAGVSRTSNTLLVAVVAAVVILTVGAALRLVARPPFVDRVTVVNRSSLELDIDTAGSGSGEWTPAGVIDPRATTTFPEVVDHGDTWWIRATAAGHTAAWQASRAALDHDHWRVTVPRAVVDALVAEGAVSR